MHIFISNDIKISRNCILELKIVFFQHFKSNFYLKSFLISCSMSISRELNILKPVDACEVFALQSFRLFTFTFFHSSLSNSIFNQAMCFTKCECTISKIFRMLLYLSCAFCTCLEKGIGTNIIK